MADPEKTVSPLMAAIDELVQKSTFSLDAMEGISKLRLRVQSLETANNNLARDLAATQKEAQRLAGIESRCASVEKINEALTKSFTEKDKAEAVATAKAGVYQECFGLVFRNIEMRREMVGTVPPPMSSNPNYYPPSSVAVSESTSVTPK